MTPPEGYAAHPEGGWFRETWRSTVEITTPRGPRASATAISYLLETGQESRWHRVRGAAELWIWTGGGAMRLTVGGVGAAPSDPRTVVLEPGEQHLVGPDEWQCASPVGAASAVACVVSPGFDYADFEVLDATVPETPVRPVSVLLICQANMCRSPIAQALLGQLLVQRGASGVAVSSAGLRTVDDSAMAPATVEALARRDLALPDFRTRRFAPALASADLVLTATVAQRDEVVRRAPDARRRTFAWRELAALVDLAPLVPPRGATLADRMADAMLQVDRRRGQVQPHGVDGFDVTDPIGRAAKVFDRVTADIGASMASVATLLEGVASRRSAA